MRKYNIVGLVMAGGQSRRMGQDKSTLSYHGQTFIAHAWQTLQQLKADQQFVCGKHADYPSIHDSVEFAGPASAIAHAIKNPLVSSSEVIIALPLDMPCVSHTDLARLLETLIKHDVDNVFYKGHPFPCAIKTQALITLLENETRLRDISMLRLLTGYLCAKSLPLPTERQEAFININTESDYMALKKRFPKSSEKAC